MAPKLARILWFRPFVRFGSLIRKAAGFGHLNILVAATAGLPLAVTSVAAGTSVGTSARVLAARGPAVAAAAAELMAGRLQTPVPGLAAGDTSSGNTMSRLRLEEYLAGGLVRLTVVGTHSNEVEEDDGDGPGRNGERAALEHATTPNRAVILIEYVAN